MLVKSFGDLQRTHGFCFEKQRTPWFSQPTTAGETYKDIWQVKICAIGVPTAAVVLAAILIFFGKAGDFKRQSIGPLSFLVEKAEEEENKEEGKYVEGEGETAKETP